MLDTTAAVILVIGAVFITIIGAAANYATQKEGNKINVKTVSRDFMIGLALSSAAYFFVPESFESLGKSLNDIKLPELSGGGSGGGGSGSSGGGDLDLHIGPAQF